MLEFVLPRLESLEGFSVGSLEKCFEEICQARETKLGHVAQPVRVAITGTTISPSIFETLQRLERAGRDSFDSLLETPVETLAGILGSSPPRAERFLREARALAERTGGALEPDEPASPLYATDLPAGGSRWRPTRESEADTGELLRMCH